MEGGWLEKGFVSMVKPVLRCRSFFWGPTPGPDSRLKDFVRTQEPQKQKIRKDGSVSGSVSVPAQAPAACTATLGMTSNQRSRVRIPNILPNPTECVYCIYIYSISIYILLSLCNVYNLMMQLKQSKKLWIYYEQEVKIFQGQEVRRAKQSEISAGKLGAVIMPLWMGGRGSVRETE